MTLTEEQLTEEKTLENFKHILEYLVAALEWLGNKDHAEAYARQFPGHAVYIQPRLDDGTMPRADQKGFGGYKSKIQGSIAPWKALADDHSVCFKLEQWGRPMTKGNFLGWYRTWVNIKANWVNIKVNVEPGITQDTHRVRSLYVCHEPDTLAPDDITMTLEELGLFDGQGPNDNLKRFWQEFKYQYDHYEEPAAPAQYSADDLVKQLTDLTLCNKNVVLTGAPGTGKTYLAKQVAQALTGGQVAQAQDDKQNNPFVGFVQFHPSYDYTDFVEGLRPENQTNGQLGFALQDGTFKEFCAKAKEDPEQPFVFIIDEINRGEISKIFGELFFAIDPDYRGTKVTTQYQTLIQEGDAFADGFYVPENVYIIATMNDIDRSVECIDFAFRRRFTWFEVKPDVRMTMLKVDNLKAVKDNEALKAKLEQANFTALCQGYCKRLNDAISAQPYLGSAYEVGPAYFLKTLNYLELDNEVTEVDVKAALEKVWRYHLDPLLSEYLRGKHDITSIIFSFRKAYEGQTK